MLITGSLNTISTNAANQQKARGTEAPSTIWGKINNETDRDHLFDHPFFQAAFMFLGEFLCLHAHMATKKQRTPTPAEITAEAEGGADAEPPESQAQKIWSQRTSYAEDENPEVRCQNQMPAPVAVSQRSADEVAYENADEHDGHHGATLHRIQFPFFRDCARHGADKEEL